MTDYGEYVTRDLRLVLLRELAQQPQYTANETVLRLAAEAYGHKRTREHIRAQLRWLEEAQAVKLADMAGVLVATLTRRGLDHVEGRAVIDGVHRPAPEG
ncbi:MAG TPA: hypothetical protein ENK13_05605 [Thermopetrobacter sp.]|nr:hypothetical protein [Thermopetrobacter sp.]